MSVAQRKILMISKASGLTIGKYMLPWRKMKLFKLSKIQKSSQFNTTIHVDHNKL